MEIALREGKLYVPERKLFVSAWNEESGSKLWLNHERIRGCIITAVDRAIGIAKSWAEPVGVFATPDLSPNDSLFCSFGGGAGVTHMVDASSRHAQSDAGVLCTRQRT